MNKILIFFGLLLFSNLIEGSQTTHGNVDSFSKYSDWQADLHQAHITVSFEDEDNSSFNRQFILNLAAREMIDFNLQKGTAVLLLDEAPANVFGSSIFQMQFAGNLKVYEGNAPMISLTPTDWGVDDNSFMVTDVVLNSSGKPAKIILNGNTTMEIESASDNIIGKIFYSTPQENYIPTNPGFSSFCYSSHEGESFFKRIAPSVNSHWTPSQEQIKEVITVKFSGTIRKAYIIIDAVVLTGGNDYYETAYQSPHKPGWGTIFKYNESTKPHWTKNGDRWIVIRKGLYVDLEAAYVLEEGMPPRKITQTW